MGAPALNNAQLVDCPVFLVNLDRSTDRRAFMKAQAVRIGLQFERVPAVVGKAVPDDLWSQFLDPDGRSLSGLADGEIGCYASHLVLHQRIVREGLPFALILEDDVVLRADLMLAATSAIAAAPRSWDYIHLSGSNIKRAVLSIARLPNERHLVRHTRLPVNMGGYLISRQGAEKMLRRAPRIRPVDQEIRFAWLRDIDVLGVYPPPVIWGDALPTTIRSTWRTEAKPKNNWSPGLVSEVRGRVYRLRKLGILGSLACLKTNARLALDRRMGRRLSGDGRAIATIVLVR